MSWVALLFLFGGCDASGTVNLIALRLTPTAIGTFWVL